jgi:hypothetical protein
MLQQKLEAYQKGPINQVEIDLHPNKPCPILHVQLADEKGLQDFTITTLIQVHLYNGDKIAKFWVDARMTPQNRPVIVTQHVTKDGTKTRNTSIVGTFREPRNDTEIFPER